MKKRLLLVLIPLLCGCSLLKLPSLETPKSPKTLYNWKETIVKKPQAVISNGKIIVVEEITQEIVVDYEKLTPEKTFMQKVGSWIAGLSLVGFLLICAGFVVAPAATIGILLGYLKKWKTAMKETVIAINASNATEDEKIKNALAAKQSVQTKKIVDSIKRTL